MNRFNLIVLTILAVLMIIVIFQNSQMVLARILVVEVRMPLVLLLLVTLLIGFALGTSWKAMGRRGR